MRSGSPGPGWYEAPDLVDDDDEPVILLASEPMFPGDTASNDSVFNLFN